MADIVLKIIIDGKEAVATIDTMQDGFSELQSQMQAIDKNKLTGLTNELKQVTEASESAGQGLAGLTQRHDQTTQSSTRLKMGSQNMNMAIMQAGYILNDASMATVNFRFALMGVANNIPMVIQGMMAAKNEAGGMGKTLGQLAMESIKGPGGVLLAVNALMLALQILPGLFGETTAEIEKQKSAVDKLRDSYNKLTKAELENRLSDYEQQLAELEAKHPEMRAGSFSSGTSVGGLGPGVISREKYQVTGEARYGSDNERVKSLEKQIKLIKELVLDLGVEESIERNIALNREKLEKMNENPESKNYWKKLVPDSTSYDNARKLLNLWIEADEKIFAKEKRKKTTRGFDRASADPLAMMLDEMSRGELQDEDTLLEDYDWQAVEKLKIDAMKDGFAKREAIIELWYAEQKETQLYRESASARDAIDQQYLRRKEENLKQFDDLTKSEQLQMRALTDATNTFWEQFIIGGRQAKDEWDALWLSFKNSALRSLGEILQEELFSSLFSAFSGEKGGGNFFTDILSFLGGLLPFFGTGGIVTRPTAAIVGDVPEAIIPLHQLHNFSSGSLERKLDEVINAFVNKQFEIDLFKLKTAQQGVNEMVRALSVKS